VVFPCNSPGAFTVADYLIQRRKGYAFQISVPPDLRAKFGGKRHVVKGLDTRDYDIAKARALQLAAKHLMQFEAERSGANPSAGVLRRLYLDALAQLGEDKPETYVRDLGDGDYDDGTDHMIDGLLAEADGRGWWPDRDDDPPPLPPDLQARWDALIDYRAKLAGAVPPNTLSYALPFSECSKLYLDTSHTGTTNQTRAQHESVYRLFADFVGDKPLQRVTKLDAVQFFDEVVDLHPDWGRSPKTKERSYKDIKALYWKKGGRLSGGTLKRYANHFAGLWKWAKGRGEVTGDNLFGGLVKHSRRRKGNTYQPFTMSELTALFDPPPKSTWLWEVAVVALYSGMRANEICSLTWENIVTDDGVLCFDIVAAKSDAGVRRVPIHSALGWLPARRPEGDQTGLLWPNLKPGGLDANHAVYYSKAFGTWSTARGITGEGRVFHSFRKNAVECMERAGVPETSAALIVGHERTGMTYGTYGVRGLTMPQRRVIVELIQYPGLKLPIAA